MLYLDIDGVLADFVGGVCDLFQVSPEIVRRNWTAGEWCLLGPLSKTLDREVTEDEMWNEVHNVGERFWEELEPTPYYHKLLKAVKQYYPIQAIRLLSSPSRCPTSYSGKARWVKEYFGSANLLIPTSDKHLLSKRGTILIDDSDKNCSGFEVMGGTGIVFPSIANSLHHLSDPVEYVKNRLHKERVG